MRAAEVMEMVNGLLEEIKKGKSVVVRKGATVRKIKRTSGPYAGLTHSEVLKDDKQFKVVAIGPTSILGEGELKVKDEPGANYYVNKEDVK